MRGRTDYNKANLKLSEKIFIWGKGLFLTIVISYLFYDSIISFFVLLPLAILVAVSEKKRIVLQRQKKLQFQFKDGITVLLSGLEAGYSIENAFKDACAELNQMYQKETDIEIEFKCICAGLELNEQLETLLFDFAKRSGVEDIRSFAEIFAISKHRGGDIITIVKSSIATIQEKLEVKQEIDTLLAGKRLEQNIMNIVPIGILFYVKITSPDFLNGLYGNFIGIMVMSICLLVYLGAFVLGKHLIEVEI